MAGANKAPAFLAFCRHTTKIFSRLQIILSVLLGSVSQSVSEASLP